MINVVKLQHGRLSRSQKLRWQDFVRRAGTSGGSTVHPRGTRGAYLTSTFSRRHARHINFSAGNIVQDRVTSKSREEISTKISIWVLMRKVLRFLSARFSQSKVVQGVILEKLHDPDASHCSPGCLTYRSCRHMIMLAEACCRDRFAGYRRSAPAP